MQRKVNVIGLGYIGLPTALMMAAHGIDVVGSDYNEGVLSSLQAGKLSFQEKGLEDLFQVALKKGITFSKDYLSTDMYVVSVATPYDKASRKIDPHYVIAAVTGVLAVCQKNAMIVIESTVSPGTIDRYIRPLVEEHNQNLIDGVTLAHAPERIIPGNMVYELIHNSRTIGADDRETGEAIRQVYASFCQGDIEVTDIRTAEMTKVVENAYRDVNIAFANELAKICRSDNMDVYEIVRIANKHPRVNILSPGPGVGGHCISVDPWFLVGDYPELAKIIKQAREINDSMPDFVLSRIKDILKKENISDITQVGFYGVTYKENVDDVRESPTIQLIQSMQNHLAQPPKCYDPMLKKKIISSQCMDFESFIEQIKVMIVMTGHHHLRQVQNLIHQKVILDTRNCGLAVSPDNKMYLL